jgi:glycosyltransferase involved in cell wall biosynthesis
VSGPVPGSGDAGGRPLRVLQLITMLELGGAQGLALDTVTRLERRRFAPQLAAGPGGLLDEAARTLTGAPFTTVPHLVREVRPRDDARAFAELLALFRRVRPDVVHTNSSKAGVLGRFAAAAAGVPIVVHTVHGWGFHPWQSRRAHALYVALERAAARVTTQLVAVSEANARAGAREEIAPYEAFEIIRPGVHTARFAGARRSGGLRAELGLAEGAPLAGMVGCLKPQKAPVDFVRAAAHAAARVPGSHFVLVGDGVLRPEVEQAVAAAGLAGRFHLLGWRRDPEVVVGDLDLFVLSSLHEGLPMVIPEAMAAGVPVVATAVDGTPEAVRHGVTGLLCPPRDPGRLGEAIAALLAEPERRLRMGAAAAADAPRWDVAEMVRQQERLYLRLAREAGLPAPGRPAGRVA